jgi:hypothetical protein
MRRWEEKPGNPGLGLPSIILSEREKEREREKCRQFVSRCQTTEPPSSLCSLDVCHATPQRRLWVERAVSSVSLSFPL